ncbi:hypothetical protein ColTof4_01071 [Colletotrichum tofieldiae]|nr:hypothetical protein ColTof3_08293 [Colletotrichum tofieldiae]GKT68648.1 hypothetical protein ColTof4_01071 [Colletotrichum tofieldiae]
MYIRPGHAEYDLRILRRIVKENPLGIFTTVITSPSFPLLQSTHIPFVLDVEDESSENELGRLRGHLARQNPQSKAIIEDIISRQTSDKCIRTLEHDVLVLFSSPVHHYVTPKFYTETKPTTGKVVPTWNYSAVQVYGKATVYIDSKSDETSTFLGQQIHDLSEYNERVTMGFTGQGDKPGPWKVTDAPERYIDLLKKAIIGVEITIEKMEGKFKMSQEMSNGDIDGVIRGFDRLGTETGRELAKTVKERKEIKNNK